MGHCVTPVPYQYNGVIALEAIQEIKMENIMEFFKDFTGSDDVTNAGGSGGGRHVIGSEESKAFAERIREQWQSFGLRQVEMDNFKEEIPVPSSDIPSEVRILDASGQVLWSKQIEESVPNVGQVVYSASAIGQGKLVYGHFGRYEDLHDLQTRYKLNFTDAVVVLKTNRNLYHPGSMIRNAQLFGAKAAILFPDPLIYLLNRKGQLANLPENVSLSHSGKFVPGDPLSPYAGGQSTSPRIPVVSLSYADAKVLLSNFTDGRGIHRRYWYGLPLRTELERNFSARIEVNRELRSKELHNVIGSIPGRYEPTRYVVIGSHHDTWHQGASKPGIGHSVLMQMAKIFGYLYKIGWKPGRSIIFASWDGEEFGELGSTSWLYRHSKEIGSRGVAYVNMDYLLQGSDEIHVPSSPLLRDALIQAAKTVACKANAEEDKEEANADGQKDQPCRLYDQLLDKIFHMQDKHGNNSVGSVQQFSDDVIGTGDVTASAATVTSSSFSVFQNMLGISSVDLSLKNRHSRTGDSYPFVGTPLDTMSRTQRYLELKHAESMGRFLTILVMQLVTMAQLPLSATSYGHQVQQDLARSFLPAYADAMAKNKVRFGDIQVAAKKFAAAADKFHFDYDASPALEMLSHHEFNDQLLELERSLLLPPFVHPRGQSEVLDKVLDGPFRQVIYGPSPLNLFEASFLPRLSVALRVALADDTEANWDVVERETFFVVNALESASCVLDNHLVANPDEHHHH